MTTSPISAQTVSYRASERGYNKWRYFPLEGGRVPTTHPGAMLEIASATVDVLRAEVFTDHGIHTIDRRLNFAIERLFKHEAWFQSPDFLSLGREEISDLQNWISGYNNRIDAFADLVRRYQSQGINKIPMLPTTRTVLEEAMRIANARTGQDFRQFLYRAGHGNSSLVWNSDQGIFEP